jgi:hypothetical protein
MKKWFLIVLLFTTDFLVCSAQILPEKLPAVHRAPKHIKKKHPAIKKTASTVHYPSNGQVKDMEVDDGIYTGAVKNGLPDGKGELREIDSVDGTYLFTGNFSKGIKTGFGSLVSPNRDRYDGQWKDNNQNGHGIFTYANGDRYEGQFLDGVMDGEGAFYWVNGDKYVGQWKDDYENGQGVFTFANENRYEGHFKDGKKDAKGTYYWANGDQGQWENDKMNGYGMKTVKTGASISNCPGCAMFKGNWKDGKKNGYGECYDIDGKLLYAGQFADDKPVGSYPGQ